jgi:hypothetical protein
MIWLLTPWGVTTSSGGEGGASLKVPKCQLVMQGELHQSCADVTYHLMLPSRKTKHCCRAPVTACPGHKHHQQAQVQGGLMVASFWVVAA